MNRLNFTKEAIKAIKPPSSGRDTYHDLKSTLELRVTARGVKTFCMRRRVRGSGKLERITLGRFRDDGTASDVWS